MIVQAVVIRQGQGGWDLRVLCRSAVRCHAGVSSMSWKAHERHRPISRNSGRSLVKFVASDAEQSYK